MGFKADQVTFERGIVTELVEPAFSLVGNGGGARRLEGFTVYPQGPAATDPPWRYLGSIRNQAARLFRVVYSESIAFQVEIGVHGVPGTGYCRIWNNGGQVLDGADPYEIASPYGYADLARLKVYNDAGTLYLWHPAHPPYRLIYTAETSWTLTALPCTWGPFRDENTTAVTVASDGVTGDVTLTASAALFVAGQVGALWRLGHRVPAGSVSESFTGDAAGTSISVPKDVSYQVTVTGTYSGVLVLEKTYNGSDWETVLVLNSADGPAFDQPGVETHDDALYRLRMTAYVSGTCTAVLQVAEHVRYGYARLTAVNSPTEAEATVLAGFASTDATAIWSEGAWSDYRGYPRNGGMIEGRLAHQSTVADPTTQWLSASGKYTQMRTGSVASDALTFTFNTGRGDPFLWLDAQRLTYFIGTPSAILEISAADPRSALSHTNQPSILRRIEMGSADIPPVRMGSSLIFVGPTGKRVMQTMYDWQQDRLLSPDLCWTCPGLTDPGIKRICYQPTPFPLLWVLRSDGVLLGCTLEERPDKLVVAWHQHAARGDIEDIEVLPNTSQHQLWRIVSRAVDGISATLNQWQLERQDALDLRRVRVSSPRLEGYVPYAAAATGAVILNSDGTYLIAASYAHPFSNGDQIRFTGVSLPDSPAAAWLEGRVVQVSDAAAHSYRVKALGGSYVALPAGGYEAAAATQVENTFAALDHFEGEAVYALADGCALGPFTVAGGAIVLPGYYHEVYAGLLPPDAVIQPLRLVIPTRDGSTRGRAQHFSGLWLSLYRSWGGKFGRDAGRLEPIRYFDEETAVDAAPELVTKDLLQRFEGSYDSDPILLLVQDQPFPLTVRALMIEAGIHGAMGH